MTVRFALEELYEHQDYDWVVDTVPAVLAFAKPNREPAPFPFEVSHRSNRAAASRVERLELRWNLAALRAKDPDVVARAARMRAGRTAQREHVVELAGYGLALVAISVFLPGRRVIHMMKGVAPDLLFDVTPGALRGVEVAARSRGGSAVLRGIAQGASGKAATLYARVDVTEAHLSLWSGAPRVAIMEGVKP